MVRTARARAIRLPAVAMLAGVTLTVFAATAAGQGVGEFVLWLESKAADRLREDREHVDP